MVGKNSIAGRNQNLGIFRQYSASMIASLPMLMSGMAIAWPSPVLPMIIDHMTPIAMDHTQISWMVSLLFLGNTISPLPVGYLMDMFGRKQTLYMLNVMPLMGWILTYYGQSPGILYAGRFLIGLWFGVSCTLCPVYIGEIADPSIRGALSIFNHLFRSVGGLLVLIVGPYISYYSLALLCGLLPAIFFFVAVFMPESPYFLLMKNRKDEAKEALRWLRGEIDEQDLECELCNIEKTVIAQTQTKASFKDAITDIANCRAMIIVIILAIVKTLSGYDVMMSYISISLPPYAFDSLGPNECVIILGLVSVVTCIGSIFIIDRFSRRLLLTISTLGCATMTLLAGLWFFFDTKTDINVIPFAQLPFYCFLVHGISYSSGLGPALASVKGELFATNIKGIGSAMSTILFAVLNFITAKIYLFVADNLGMYGNYFIYAAGSVTGLIFILLYVVDTRGKTLHEIQEILSPISEGNRV